MRQIFYVSRRQNVSVEQFSDQIRQVLTNAHQGRLFLSFSGTSAFDNNNNNNRQDFVMTTPSTPGETPRPQNSTFDPTNPQNWLDMAASIIGKVTGAKVKRRTKRQSSSSYYYSQCPTDVVRASCDLLNQNNNGTVFLLPWVLEDLFSGATTSRQAQAATPLAVVVAMCSGKQASTFYGSQLCPDRAMLQATSQLGAMTYTQTAVPTYVGSIVGGPSYATSGKPSMNHFRGLAVDFLCGRYIYSSATDSCPRISANCYRSSFRNTFFPAQDPVMGCGDNSRQPITAAHCSY